MALRTGKSPSRRRQRGNFIGMLFLSVAILGGALILSRKSSRVEADIMPAPIVAQFDSISVPVPVSFVPAGSKIKDIRFKTVSFPKHQVPAGAIRDLTPMLEGVTISPLPANLPLFEENLSLTAHMTNPVIERIPPGMRAMTIRVDATSAVEGWAGSGSIVDVLLVTKEKTSVVAEKVRVLSAERSVSPIEGSSSPTVPSTVTLLVTQEQCLAVNTAIPLGKIAFALRSAKDEENWESTSYTAERLKGNPALTEKKTSVTGVISFHGENEKRSYALSNGKWVKTDSIPDGFLIPKD